jgi:hypothetical protein
MADIHDHVVVEQAMLELRLTRGDDCPVIIYGEANDGANVGDGTGEIYRDKTGVTLNFRTLKEGPNVTIETVGDTVVISATSGGILGPDPSTLRAIATYADITGTALLDNVVRIDDTDAGENYRTIQILSEEVTPVWLDAIQLRQEPANGLPGGPNVRVGSNQSTVELRVNAEAYVSGFGGTGRIIHEKISSPWTVHEREIIQLPEGDTSAPLLLETLGANGASAWVYVGSRDPQNNITAAPGSLYIRGSLALSNASIYQHRGTGSSNNDWVEIAGTGDVIGPPSAVDESVALFNGTTGKLIKDSHLKAVQPDTDHNVLQIEDIDTPALWLDALQHSKRSGGGLPPDNYIELGNSTERALITTDQDPYILSTASIAGKILWTGITSAWDLPERGSITNSGNDTVATLSLATTGTNPGLSNIHIGDRNPEGLVTANPGSYYLRTDGVDSAMYQLRSAASANTPWVEVGVLGGITADDVLIQEIGGVTPIVNVQDSINQFGMAGSAQNSSAYIVDVGGGNIDVAGGFGWLRATDQPSGELFSINWSSVSAQPIPLNTIRYIGVEYNGGSPQVTIRSAEDFNHHTDFRLGTAVNQSGTLHILNNTQWASSFGSRMFERFFETRPLERAERLGGIIPANAGTRNITVSAGELYDGIQEFVIASIDTTGSDTFDAYYRDGVGGWTGVVAQSQWDNGYYDNGSGTLIALTANRYSMHWLYIEADGDLVLLYGQSEWTTEGDAAMQPPPADVPPRIDAHGRLLGRIVYQEGQSTPESVVNVWEQVFAAVVSGGNVFGPASAVDSSLTLFDGGTGKLIKDSPTRFQDLSNTHVLQFAEPVAPFAVRDVLQIEDVPVNGLPGGNSVIVGNTDNSLGLRTSTDPYVETSTLDGKVLWEKMADGWDLQAYGQIQSSGADTQYPLRLITTGTNGATAAQYVGDRDPIGNITAAPGSFYTRVGGTSSRLYQHRGSTSNNTDWVDISAAGGGSLSGDWRFESTVGGAPSSGRYRFNNATQSSSTAIHIHDTSRSGADWSNILSKLASGDAIYVQQSDDGSRYHMLDVTGNAIDQTTYWEVPITVDTSGSDIQSGKDCAIVYFFTGGGSGGTAPNVGFYAYRTSGNITISSGSQEYIGFNAKRDDTGGDYTTATLQSYFTCPTAGRYVFAGHARMSISAAGLVIVQIWSSVHGDVMEGGDSYTQAGTVCPHVSATLYCDAGETIELRAYQLTGFAATLLGSEAAFTGTQIMAV